MKRIFPQWVLSSCVFLIVAAESRSQPLLFNTLAGRTASGNADGPGNVATFNTPCAVAVDRTGNIYVADSQNGAIRRISLSNMVSTFAGVPGVFGSSDGSSASALFNAPQGITVNGSGVLYVADSGNATIRKITTNGVVTTLAGNVGNRNSFDGLGTNGNFFQPEGIALDDTGNLYVADALNHTIRKVTPGGLVSTLAGLAGNSGSLDGTNSKARFNRPSGIALDSSNNLFVTDSLNHTIRKITPGGTVRTIAGLPGVWGNTDGTNSASRFFQPQGIAVDHEGTLFVADSGNQTLRRISAEGTNWVVSTVAGFSGSAGHVDAPGNLARFYFPAGLAVNGAGYLYVADAGNNAVRNEGFKFSYIDTLADGQLVFRLNGKRNLNYAIEGSIDFSYWTVVTNISSPDGVLDFVDVSPGEQKHFYRAKVSLP